jgi:hypothetical protein
VRIGFALFLWVASVMPAASGTWDIMYLAYTGGSRLIQVEPDEAEQIDAFVKSEVDGAYLLGLDCTHIRLANGEPFFKKADGTGKGEVELLASFDGGQSTSTGVFHYSGGAYSVPYGSDLVEQFAASRKLKISEPSSGFEVEFSLEGFSQAYEKTGCTQGTP